MAPFISNHEIFAAQNKPPFDMHAQELPGRLSVKLRLSQEGAENISSIINQLEKSLEEFQCDPLQGNIVKFSGYPSRVDFGENQVLSTVRMYDPKAMPC